MHSPSVKWNDSFFWSVFWFQTIILIIYGLWVDYGDDVAGDASAGEVQIDRFYAMFQDVHIMIFIGFGFLMTFLRKYGYSAVSYNFILAALCFQWSIIIQNFVRQLWKNPFDSKFFDRYQDILVDVRFLTEGDFAAGSFLITFGAVIGKVTPTQLVWVVFFEMFWYSANESLIIHSFRASDPGGSMVIHTFGAFFGLGLSKIMTPKNVDLDDCKPVYHSDLFSMIGTIFLWCFWPSFNGALVSDVANSRHRAAVNTLFSLCGSCVAAGALSRLTRGGKFEMVDIQNATLAGGVAMGAACACSIGIWGAILTGMVAGAVSIFGFRYLQEFLYQKIGLHDTCGVLNLHGMPGIIGGLASAVAAVAVDDSKYGGHIEAVWFGREVGRSAGRQGAYQVAATGVAVGLGLLGGILTGLFLNSRLFAKRTMVYSDSEFWSTPEETPLYHSASQTQNLELTRRHRTEEP